MELSDKIKWQILIRAAFLLTMGVSATILHVHYGESFSKMLIASLVVGILFCLITTAALYWLPKTSIHALAWVQIIWDIGYTSFLVHQTGGLYSAFVILLALQILTAAAVLSYRGALGATAGALLGFLAIASNQIGVENLSELRFLIRFMLVESLLLLFGGSVAGFFRGRENLAVSLREAESSLKDLSRLYSTIVENVPSGILYIDAAGFIQFMNSSAVRMLGGDWIHKNIKTTNLSALLRQEERFESEVFIGNQKKIFGHHRTVLPTEDSVIVFQDVTAFRNLENKVALQEKLASLGQLAAGIAHEIRNPLASLSGSIQVLKSELTLNAESERLMNIVLRETDRLDHLAHSFLSYARPNDLRAEDVDLSNLVSDVLTLARGAQQMTKGVQIRSQVPAHLHLVADPSQLKQILWNLVLNASQSMSGQGEVFLTAQERSHNGEDIVRLEVRDTGAGMDVETRKKIFDPFFTTKTGGTGLGLTLVYQMVKNHGGSIGVESELGKGTCFWVDFFKRGPKIQTEEAFVA